MNNYGATRQQQQKPSAQNVQQQQSSSSSMTKPRPKSAVVVPSEARMISNNNEVSNSSGSKNAVRPASSVKDYNYSDSEQQLVLLMYIVGGREVGQVTVFRRPISVWRLDLTKTF